MSMSARDLFTCPGKHEDAAGTTLKRCRAGKVKQAEGLQPPSCSETGAIR